MDVTVTLDDTEIDALLRLVNAARSYVTVAETDAASKLTIAWTKAVNLQRTADAGPGLLHPDMVGTGKGNGLAPDA